MKTIVFVAALVVVSAGCTRHTLRAADPAIGVSLPRDHAGHADAQTEFWHYHGHVIDDGGHRYDWFLAVVRQHTDVDRVAGLPVRWFVDPFYTSYFTVAERDTGKFHLASKVNFPDTWTAHARDDRLEIRHDSWRVAADANQLTTLRASSTHTDLSLRLQPFKPPALMGQAGYLHFPPRSSHYYYLMPRFAAEGTLTIDGVAHTVHGTAWFKHEWGFLYDENIAGWHWFGMQLSNGTELQIAMPFAIGGNMLDGSFADLIERDGKVTSLPLRELDIEETGETWRSPRTNTVYPTGWTIEIPGRASLVLKAVIDRQELAVFPANFWAGTLSVAGTLDGEEITGDCFAEIVGVDKPFGRALLRTGKPNVR